jgi:two-component system, NtrC family, response regulator HydG
VSVNCAALTETLLESEHFGHVKGAFTGAERDRKGLFEVADHGTLFLDEVADMSLGMQAKLLRALQEGEIWAVGARRAIKVDVRIVAACNRDLQDMVKEGSFRQDLYFRLNVVRVVLPPLRERGEDMALLVNHFLQRFEKEHGRAFRVAQSAIDLLQRYDWPGNVRELEACLLNACLFCDGSTLTESHFAHKPELGKGGRDGAGRGATRGGAVAGGILLDVGDLSLAELEERAIIAALERSAGNKVEAARRLGVTRQTLYNKLKALNIEVRRDIRRGD